MLVVATLDRIGRRWLETVNALGDLRRREVRVRSLPSAEDPKSPEGFTGHLPIMALAWVAQAESEAISRRTVAGLDRALAQGKRIGRPPSCTEEQVAAMLSLNPPKDTDGRREGSGRGWVRELQGRWPGLLG